MVESAPNFDDDDDDDDDEFGDEQAGDMTGDEIELLDELDRLRPCGSDVVDVEESP